MIFSPSSINLLRATEALKNNQLIGLPTETVYGLAGNALSDVAIQRIFALKGRPATNPLIVHIADFNQIDSLIAPLNTQQAKNLEKLKVFWPGPLTIILPKSSLVPDLLTANSPTVAIRIPNHQIALKIIRDSGLPLAAPSANRSNYISPTSAQHVLEEFGEELEFIIDGGSCTIGLESTVISLVSDIPQILRPGAITLNQIRSIIPEVQLLERILSPDAQQSAPGQQIKHYSPKTKLIFKEDYKPTKDLQKIAYVAFTQLSELEQKSFFSYKLLSTSGNLTEIAQKLFGTLRELDQQNLDLIIIDKCPEEQLGLAIMDRLKRATN